MEEDGKLGLFSVVSSGVGLVVATSCLLSLCEGASAIGTMFIVSIIIACLLNMITAASLSELNALMPNMTGGLAQYTMAGVGYFPTIVSMVGGYLICNSLTAPAEGAMFGLVMKELLNVDIPASFFAIGMTVVLMTVNLRGVDMFAKLQNVIAFSLIGSLVILGLAGTFGTAPGEYIEQIGTSASFQEGVSMSAAAFWLFIGCEFVIPISPEVRNPHRNIPLGMFIGLAIIAGIQILMVLGIRNFVPWDELAASDAPHILYGVKLFGAFGEIWIGLISILAAVSTQNSVINAISQICRGMSKANLLPQFLSKTDKRGTPYVSIILVSLVIICVEGSGLASSDEIIFLILTASVFWMVSYIITHINILVLRRRLPKAPRNFKLPFGPVLPIIGIIGTAYMIMNISNDPDMSQKIWMIAGAVFVALSIYAILWIKIKIKRPLFQPVPLHEVLAMEHPLYYVRHYRKPQKNPIKEQK